MFGIMKNIISAARNYGFGVLTLLMSLLLPAATLDAAPPSAAGAAAVSDSGGRNGDRDMLELPPEELLRQLDNGMEETGSWFARERSKLLRFALGSGASVVAGLTLIWLCRRFYRGRKPERTRWRGELTQALATPAIALLMLTSCFFFTLPLLKDMPPRVYTLDVRLFYAAGILIAAWGTLKTVSVMDRRLRRFAERNDNALDDLTVGMIGTVLKIAIAVTVLLFVGQNILKLNITALLAGAGVIGLAVALAAKDTISNFFGTLVIIADAPFRLGDRIRAGEIDGLVLHVGMRSSKILTEDESVCTVPNSVLTNTVVNNLSRRGHLKHVLELGLTYDTTPEQMERAMAILHGIMDDFHGPDAPKYSPHIFFSGFSASSVNIRAIVWFKTDSFQEAERLLNELNLSILRRFAASGLAFAYPTRTVYVRNAPTDGRR